MTEDNSGQISPAYTQLHRHTQTHTDTHNCPAPHWLGHCHRTSPPPHCSLMPQWLLVILITPLFYIFKLPAAPFQIIMFGVTLFYTTIFCSAFLFSPSLLQSTVCVCVCVCLCAWFFADTLTHISPRKHSHGTAPTNAPRFILQIFFF